MCAFTRSALSLALKAVFPSMAVCRSWYCFGRLSMAVYMTTWSMSRGPQCFGRLPCVYRRVVWPHCKEASQGNILYLRIKEGGIARVRVNIFWGRWGLICSKSCLKDWFSMRLLWSLDCRINENSSLETTAPHSVTVRARWFGVLPRQPSLEESFGTLDHVHQ